MNALRFFLAIVIMAFYPSWLWAGQIVVFGDSLSDVGNVYTGSSGATPAPPAPPHVAQPDPPSPPYFQGRMSNGPLWVDQLADMLNVAGPEASQKATGGTAYAYAGAAIGPATRIRPSIAIPGQTQVVSDTGKQIDDFLLASPGGRFAADQIVLFWGGSQNLLQAALFAASTGAKNNGLAALAASITEFESELRRLDANGALRVVVPNQIDPSSAPFFNGYGPPLPPGTKALVAEFTPVFNAQLDAMLAGLMSDSAVQLQLYPVDMFGLFKRIEADPSAYGFTNNTAPAFIPGLGQVVPDPTGYLFWDPIHPTTQAHLLMADAVSRALPLPGTLPLLALAIFVLAAGAAVRRAVRGSL